MRTINWTALGIAAGMSSCSLVLATPASHVAPQPVAKAVATAVATATVQAPAPATRTHAA